MASRFASALNAKISSLQIELEAADSLQRPRLIVSLLALNRLRARAEEAHRPHRHQDQDKDSFRELEQVTGSNLRAH